MVIKAVRRIAKSAGITGPVLERILDYVQMHVPDLGASNGKYSKRAQMMYETIDRNLREGRVVALGSKSWSANQFGPSGEPLSDMGLAGNHAYAVLGAHHRDDRLTLTIRNPWGHMGMSYKQNPLLSPFRSFLPMEVFERVRIEDAEFEIDIEDLIRFFGQLYLG